MTISQQISPPIIPGQTNLLTWLMGAIGAVSLATPLTWIGYSALAINHDLPLPTALDAPRRTMSGSYIGQISYYAQQSGSGRPLVLIHSINAGSSAYEWQAACLCCRSAGLRLLRALRPALYA